MKCTQRVMRDRDEIDNCGEITRGGDLCPEHLALQISEAENVLSELRHVEARLVELKSRPQLAGYTREQLLAQASRFDVNSNGIVIVALDRERTRWGIHGNGRTLNRSGVWVATDAVRTQDNLVHDSECTFTLDEAFAAAGRL